MGQIISKPISTAQRKALEERKKRLELEKKLESKKSDDKKS